MPKIELLVKLGLQPSGVDMKKINFSYIEMAKIEFLVKLGLQPSSIDMK